MATILNSESSWVKSINAWNSGDLHRNPLSSLQPQLCNQKVEVHELSRLLHKPELSSLINPYVEREEKDRT